MVRTGHLKGCPSETKSIRATMVTTRAQDSSHASAKTGPRVLAKTWRGAEEWPVLHPRPERNSSWSTRWTSQCPRRHGAGE